MTATDRLDAIEARANAATEGPWNHWPEAGWIELFQQGPDGPYDVVEVLANGIRPNLGWGSDGIYGDGPERDADFIAHARQDVPALVAALRAVLALHVPKRKTVDTGKTHDYCTSPDHYRLTPVWPCPTVTAITTALGDAS